MMQLPQLPKFLRGNPCDTNQNVQGIYSYEALTPSVIETQKAQTYIEALNFACSRPDIKNIAVTGPYGAGKSSVLLTWVKSKRNDIRVMTVSLADFHMQEDVASKPGVESKEGGGDPSGSNKARAEEKSIEYSILQQLLYKEKKSALPYSRIERISDITTGQVSVMAGHLLLMFSMAAVGMLFLFPDYIRAKLSLSPWLSQFLLDLPDVCRLGGAGASLFAAFFLMLKKLHRIGLFDRRVSVEKIDMLKGAITTRPSAPSLLNVYIDEIVYFFEQTEHDVVIFEDLDRYNDGAIFIKLREINQIINNCLPADKPVRFIYAVRDELFSTPESRTKFFDFVMPVIPVMDSENASEHFFGKFTESELSQPGFRECLSRMSVFIPDMRVMHNIANEFRLYRNIVNNGEDLKRLVSLISYKNLCAEDYHGIDKRKGVLYGIVSAYTSGELRRIYEEEIQSDILKFKSESQLIMEEEATERAEIRKDILTPYISDKTTNAVYFHLHNNGTFSLEDVIKNEDNFLNMLAGHSFYVRVRQYSNINLTTIDSAAAQQIKASYEERCEYLRLRSDGRASQLQRKIESLIQNIQILHGRDLAYFIDRMRSAGFADWVKANVISITGDNNSPVISSEQVDFMYFLLRQGYLATDYMSYRSVFMPGSLSVEDNSFIRAVSAGKAHSETTAITLNKVANVVTKLRGLGLQLQDNAWHPQVLLHFLHSDRTLLQNIINMQTEHGEEHRLIRLAEEIFPQWALADRLAYVQLLVSDDKQLAVLIRQLTLLRDTSAERQLLALLLSVPDLPWSTPSADTQAELQQLLSGYYDLPETVPAGCVARFTDNLKKSGNLIWHIPLSESEIGREVIRAVAESDLWAYSSSNLLNIFLSLASGSGGDLQTFRQKPMSSIKSLRINELNECLDRNMHDFIREIFINSAETELVPELLNSESINWSVAELIVTVMNFVVHDLAEVDNIEGEVPVLRGENYRRNLYSLLLEFDRVLPSSNQFIFLLEEDSDITGDVICEWLNKNHPALTDEHISLSEELFTQLLTKIITSEKIGIEALTKVTEIFPVMLTTVPDNIPLENAAVLISRKYFAPTSIVFEDLYQALHEKGEQLTPLLYEFVCSYPALLSQNYELVLYKDGEFDRELTWQLLNQGELSGKQCAGILNWLWEHESGIFDRVWLLSPQVLSNLAPMLPDDALRHALLIQCLKTGAPPVRALRSVLSTFKGSSYAAFLAESTYRNIEFSEPMWQLATLLEINGFIRRAKKSHSDTRIRIEPLNGAEIE